MNRHDQQNKLSIYYQQVQDIILNRQDWVSGLLPASIAVNTHGNYTDAWVRDNVYSIMSAWGLALAYRRIEENQGRAYLLEQSVVKLMRGLLTAMLRQAAKVEQFKQSQNPLDALHAKYDTKSGACVVADHEWGHLQLDATSLFLLMLAQMTASGLRIVFTIDEVNFVQNLVHYISRTYRIPDYGIWERGNKINHGIAELNASSVGMAKAALEALSGFNLFGKDGGQAAVIHVISDDIARSRNALESLLPRESISKEADSAVLSIIGFPAFAVENEIIRKNTEANICEKLEGRYGCKRFLLDGHQTAIEDSYRSYYEPHELKQFMAIECEWPLFFTYLLLNNQFSGNQKAAAHYHKKLEGLLVERDGQFLLPELYWVPNDLIAAEKENPHSQVRVPNENIPLVWAQSLFILGSLIQDGLLGIDEIDPLGRHKAIKQKECRPQIALLAQDEAVQDNLMAEGIDTQTLAEIVPIQVREAIELAEAYTHVGRNDRIGLSGRPFRQLRVLATSKVYVLSGNRLVFLPQCLNQKGFYLAMDNRLLMQRLRLEFSYIYKHWDRTGDPLFIMTIKHNMLGSHNREALIRFIKELQSGITHGVSVKLGLLSDFAETANFEKIDYLHDFQFSEASWDEAEPDFFKVLPISTTPPKPLAAPLWAEWEASPDEKLIEELKNNANLYAQLEILTLLSVRHGLHHNTGLAAQNGSAVVVRDLLEEVYARAGDQHVWYIVRRCAGLLSKYDIDLEQAATEILVRQHALSLGRKYSAKTTLTRPADSFEILQTICTGNDDASEHVIIQELTLYLGMLIKSNPELFSDMHTVRVGSILHLICIRQKSESNLGSMEEAYNEVLSLPPYQIFGKVRESLEVYNPAEDQLSLTNLLHYDESFHASTSLRFLNSIEHKAFPEIPSWHEWREQKGCIGRENKLFFTSVWDILHYCKGLVIGEKTNSKNRLDSEITLAQMTSGEQSFKLHVNHLLNKIQSPEHRQLTVEVLKAMATLFRENYSSFIDDTLVTDMLISHAVEINWLQTHQGNKEDYEKYEPIAWHNFYQLTPQQVANSILDALNQLQSNNERCTE